MENIVLLIIGLFVSVIGIVNMTGNISTIHSYHRRRVSEEDILKYGKCIGAGTLVIGIAVVIGYVLLTVGKEEIMGYCIVASLVVGIVLMLYAQFKYNKGLF